MKKKLPRFMTPEETSILGLDPMDVASVTEYTGLVQDVPTTQDEAEAYTDLASTHLAPYKRSPKKN